MPRGFVLVLAALTATAALVVATAGQAAPAVKTLSGFVGPGFTIGVSKSKVKRGLFRITIRDRSNIHNFHLTGPGVNRRTSVPATGTVVWNVRLRKGVYTFVCDPHPTMRGTFRVTA